MIDAILLGAMSTVAVLTTVYWACLVVGGGLMVLSMLGGESDADVSVDTDIDVDFDADVDLDADLDLDADGVDLSHAHAEAAALSTWFSMRFVVFFVASFIAQFGLIVLCIGFFPAAFWSTTVFGYALGELAREDQLRS